MATPALIHTTYIPVFDVLSVGASLKVGQEIYYKRENSYSYIGTFVGFDDKRNCFTMKTHISDSWPITIHSSYLKIGINVTKLLKEGKISSNQ